MKIALWFMDISQTLTCSSMADSDLGFIVVYSWPCLTVPSEDGTRESSIIIPACADMIWMFIKDLTSVLLEMYENSTMIHGHFPNINLFFYGGFRSWFHSCLQLTLFNSSQWRASSMTIPASLQSSQSLFLVIWYRRIPISFSRRGKGFLNDFEDLDFTCLSFHFLE